MGCKGMLPDAQDSVSDLQVCHVSADFCYYTGSFNSKLSGGKLNDIQSDKDILSTKQSVKHAERQNQIQEDQRQTYPEVQSSGVDFDFNFFTANYFTRLFFPLK